LRWNRGDFILWHRNGENAGICWDTKIGRGRPAWNIQDPSMIIQHFNDTLSIYCGGIDNLFRHHDYSRAILESIRPYPMARFWLHCHHLYVDNRKMSKSKGNVYYIDTLRKQGYKLDEIRFFLIYGHYRKRLNFSYKSMGKAAENLKRLKQAVGAILRHAEPGLQFDSAAAKETKLNFVRKMDSDLDVKGAIDNLQRFLSVMAVKHLKSNTAAGVIHALREIDEVLRVIF
jgi:cysteinyl-tRNA synthetase